MKNAHDLKNKYIFKKRINTIYGRGSGGNGV